jgi:hypothetical protein
MNGFALLYKMNQTRRGHLAPPFHLKPEVVGAVNAKISIDLNFVCS